MNPFACLFKSKSDSQMAAERENRMLKYGARLTQEIIAACDGNICYPINIFSANEIKEAMDGVYHRVERTGRSTKLWATYKDRQIFMKFGRKFPSSIDNDHEFFTEISTVVQLNHGNVVKLLGCCIEMEPPILIYEVFPNSLYDLLRKPNPQAPLAWENRLRIAIEIADAITYMHIAKPRPIIHRNVRTSKILLDKDYRPKLCDFALSIAIPLGETYVEDHVVGTHGYVDPNYLVSGIVTEKADVYSFGWILLELLTGKGPLELRSTEDNYWWDELDLTKFEMPEQKEEQIFNFILDSHLSSMDEKKVEQFKVFFHISVICVNNEPDKRPSMKEVAQQLRQIERYEHLLPPPFSSSFLLFQQHFGIVSNDNSEIESDDDDSVISVK